MTSGDTPQQPGAVPLLYKYVSAKTVGLILEGGSLRWSTPGTLNDVQDMQFDLHVDVDCDAVKAAALPKLWEAYSSDEPQSAGNPLGIFLNSFRGCWPTLPREEFERVFGPAIEDGLQGFLRALPATQEETRRQISKSKILCLTDSPDNTLMWSHYAEQNCGAVLGFRGVEGLDSPWQMARPVNYLPAMPRLLDSAFLADMAAGRVSMDVRSIIHRLVYTKAAVWAYEHEWRIHAGDGRNPDAAFEDVPFHPLELGSVILGCRMPDDARARTVEVVRRLYPHAELLQAVPRNRAFGLEVRAYP